jgi:segregation and condensation protein B
MLDDKSLQLIIEAALFAAPYPLTLDHLLTLFAETEQPERSTLRRILQQIQQDYAERSVELRQVASGYRFQVKAEFAPWIKRLWSENPPRYSRTLLETLAIIAYRQPITRSEIEAIRGISVSTEIIKKLMDYNWIRILAHKESAGRPALYGTTRAFLDHFNLKTLDELPTLAELREVAVGENAVAEGESLTMPIPQNDDNSLLENSISDGK